jgi:hypothetical protein
MLAAAFIGICVGLVAGARYAMGFLIPLMLAALLGAILHALAGHIAEAVIGFAMFSIGMQTAYAGTAIARTAMQRKPQPVSHLVEETDETDFAPVRALPR